MPKQKTYSYFLIYAIIGLIVVLAGFGRTYAIPMSQGALKVPIGVHIHGAFSFAWILLYLFQNILIHKKNFKLHMAMGITSTIVLIGFFISLFSAMAYGIERDLPKGGDQVYGSNMVALTSGLWVLGLGLAGLNYRKKPQVHKRLMFLATIVILWPAWSRCRHYFPQVENSDWFQLYIPFSFILLAWFWEKVTYKKVHLTLLILGTLIIIEGHLGGLYAESKPVISFVKWIFT